MNIQRSEVENPVYDMTFEDKHTDAAAAQQAADTILEALEQAKRPVIMLGHGVDSSFSQQKLIRFAQKRQIPIITSVLAKSVLGYDHPLNFGCIGGAYGHRYANMIANAKSDLLLCFGISLCTRQIGTKVHEFARGAKIIRIDIDPYNLQRDIHENGENEVKLQAETGAVIDCLAKVDDPDIEGAALQFGASVGNVCAKYLHLNESDKKIIILASMSAAFSALFGTPMAAVVFPMEVISVGVMYYAALVPCVFSAFAAQGIALLLKVRTVTPPYLVESVPNFYSVDSIKAIILAIACALAGALFCIVLHNGEHYLKKWFPNPYVRVVAGAAGVIILYFALRTDAYLGLGTGVIQASFKETAGPQMFLLKMLFTALTLCAGFKGGEIVPSLFIGATLGSFMSTILAAPTDICAACGMVGVFCAVTNSPITSLLIAAELFGFNGMPFYCIVVAVSYLLSGYYSLYKEQKIVYSKTENKYVDKHTK